MMIKNIMEFIMLVLWFRSVFLMFLMFVGSLMIFFFYGVDVDGLDVIYGDVI